MNELITKESLSYFKRKYDERVARKLGGIYSKYETNESSIDQTMMGYVYNNTPDCIIVHTNNGSEQHYLRMYDATYACVIGSMLCAFTIVYSNDEYSMDVEQYNLEGNSDNSLIIPLAESGGSWSANVSFSDIRDAVEDGDDIYFSINWAIVSTTLRKAGNNSFTLMASMTDTQNSLLKVFSVFANSGIVTATCNQYTLTAYIPPQPEATLTFANMENCVLVQDGEPVENGATFPIGEPLELAVVSQGIGEAEWYCNVLTMDGVDISGCFDGNGDPASIEIAEVTGDIHIEISCSEREEPEEEVPIESIRYTDGQGQTCIGFNMNEGETVDLWTNLRILPAGYTDGVEFMSDDDGIIQVDSGGIATATGTSGESTTITISSMEDPSIYTTVEISISDGGDDEPEEEEE